MTLTDMISLNKRPSYIKAALFVVEILHHFFWIADELQCLQLFIDMCTKITKSNHRNSSKVAKLLYDYVFIQ